MPQLSYRALLLLLLPPLVHAAVSDIFNTQPPACETCLTPAYNACEASIGPFGPANVPAFAACICASPSLARVAACGASRGSPCSDVFAGVAEAAQTWCLWNDARFRGDVCATLDADGRSRFRYIPQGVLSALCRRENGTAETDITGETATVVVDLTSTSSSSPVELETLSFMHLTATAPEIPKPTQSLATDAITSLFTASSLPPPKSTAASGTDENDDGTTDKKSQDQDQDSASSKIHNGAQFAAIVLLTVVCFGLS